MEFHNRKVYLTKYIRSIDSDGDGNLDSLVMMPVDKVLQIPITSNYDDIGVYDSVNPSDLYDIDIIDVKDVWDETNDGTSDSSDYTGVIVIENTFQDGVSSTGGYDGPISVGCLNPEANNYYAKCKDINGNVISPCSQQELVNSWNNGDVVLVECGNDTEDCCQFDNFSESITSGGGSSETNPCVPDVVKINNKLSHTCTPTLSTTVQKYPGSSLGTGTIGEFWDSSWDDAGTVKQCNSSCQWSEDKWSGYKSTALSNADIDCDGMTSNCPGETLTTVLSDSDIDFNPGDCGDNTPFAGVKENNQNGSGNSSYHESVECCPSSNIKTGYYCSSGSFDTDNSPESSNGQKGCCFNRTYWYYDSNGAYTGTYGSTKPSTCTDDNPCTGISKKKRSLSYEKSFKYCVNNGVETYYKHRYCYWCG